MKEIDVLRKENAALKDQVAGLTKRIQELEASKKPSRSRTQAEQGLKMLEAGPVTSKQFAELNEKYPADVIFNIRKLLGVSVHTVRTPSGTTYMSDAHFSAYQAEKVSESANEATEAIQASQATSASATA